MKLLRTDVPKSVVLVVMFSIIVLVSFATFTALIGGDALNGKIENGHYYVRQGAPYKEVSFLQYLLSAFLCLMVPVAIFISANRALFALDTIGVLKSKPGLRICLNIVFGVICGSVFIYALFVIWHALTVR